MKTYEEGVIQATAEQFHKWANELTQKVMDKDGIDEIAWISSAPFRTMRYIKSSTYLSEDTTLETER